MRTAVMSKGLLFIVLIGNIFAGSFSLPVQEACRKTRLGKEYRGTVSKTRGGFNCQRWDSQVPHSHKFNKRAYPDAGLSENFCRNPDGEVDGPWCYTDSTDKRWEYCDIPPCVYDKCKKTVEGKEYRGIVSTTTSGLKCQRWDSQVPHKHIKTSANYIHAGLFQNYCRNPDGEPEGPWCYTNSSEVRWEYCHVPLCGIGQLKDPETGSTIIEGKVKLASYTGSQPAESCLVVTLREAIYCISIEDCPDTTLATLVISDPEIQDGVIDYVLDASKELSPNRYLIEAVWNRGWCHRPLNNSKQWIRDGDFFNDVEHSIEVVDGQAGPYKEDIDVKKFVQPEVTSHELAGNCSEVKCEYYGRCEMSDDGSPKCVCKLACPLIFKPVCGSDGKDYANQCLLEYKSCTSKTLITVVKKRLCKEEETKKKCELKKQKVLESFPIIEGKRRPLLGAFIPQCKEDGSYEEAQCHGSTGYCWCVDEDGNKKEGTEVRFERPRCSKDLKDESDKQPIIVTGNVKVISNVSLTSPPRSCLVMKLREAIYCTEIEDCPDMTIATAIVRNPTPVEGAIPYKLEVKTKLRPNRYLIEAVWNRGWCYEDKKGKNWIKNGDCFNGIEHSIEINPSESKHYTKDIAVKQYLEGEIITDPANCNFLQCEFGKCDDSDGAPKCVCEQACPLIVKHVCGSDGKDYANECIMKFESCELKKNISVAKEGPCKPKDCEEPCPRNLDPICGKNGKTYGNECLFRIARCKNTSLEEAYKGQCGGAFLRKLVESGQITKCVMERDNTLPMPGAFVPQCEEDGSYKKVQCHGSTGFCWCVDWNGVKKEGTEERFKKPDCGAKSGQKTKCQMERENSVPMPGAFVPQCEDDGSYKEIQCHGSTGYCWCVNENGVKLEGTDVQFKQPNCGPRNMTKCEWERENTEPKPGAFVPQCEEDGSYKEVQCHGSTGYCWCFDENGFKRKGTQVHGAKPDCSKVAE
ncbi:agrin-like isoform X1 [Rhopilema esculentum]|uniref:agrin-like isoform X1 n=1 Tax=Rhopilema esculentum TaxID=499914 RepID=UPI0031D52B44